MTAVPTPPPLCLDCGERPPAGAGVCPACGGLRLLSHPELDQLCFAHLDCDAFYAAIEKRDDPSLAAKPVIVGGGRRGVVATACYLARAFGVRSAMPMFKALALCPQAVVLKPDMARYAAEGQAIRAMMRALTPLVEPMSIDEAFLDLSGLSALHRASPAEILAGLQREIAGKRGLTVSIGLSYNKFLAKLASDLEKPHGFAVIGRAEAQAFLAKRDTTSLPGIGPVTAAQLARRGVTSLGQLQGFGPREALALGPQGPRLVALARGEDLRPVDPDGERKSLSTETTLGTDLTDPAALEDVLWDLCDTLAMRARAAEIAGRTLTVKLKTSAFKTLARQRPLPGPTQLARVLFGAGRGLLKELLVPGVGVRLVGVGLTDLASPSAADLGDMLDTKTPKLAAAEAAVAKARAKFGRDALISGRSLRRRKSDTPDEG